MEPFFHYRLFGCNSRFEWPKRVMISPICYPAHVYPEFRACLGRILEVNLPACSPRGWLILNPDGLALMVIVFSGISSSLQSQTYLSRFFAVRWHTCHRTISVFAISILAKQRSFGEPRSFPIFPAARSKGGAMVREVSIRPAVDAAAVLKAYFKWNEPSIVYIARMAFESDDERSEFTDARADD